MEVLHPHRTPCAIAQSTGMCGFNILKGVFTTERSNFLL